MSRPNDNKAYYLGVLLVVAGVLFNKWFLEITFIVPDGDISSKAFIALILMLQVAAIVSGAILVLKRPYIKTPTKVQITLLISSALFTLLMLEVGANIWLRHFATPVQFRAYSWLQDIEPSQFQYSPHHYLNYALTPYFQRGLTSHNSLGYRGKEFPLRKPDRMCRIVALGGSTTYTIKVEDNDKTFTAQLERVLKEEYGHQNLEVINAGVGGYNSWESLVNLEFRVLELEPDLVIVYHGTNDVHTRLVDPLAYIGDNSARRKQWEFPTHKAWEHSDLLRILGRNLGLAKQVGGLNNLVMAPSSEIGDADPIYILEMNPPTYFRRNLESMIAISNVQGVKIMLATWAHSPLFEDYASTRKYQIGFKENNEVVKEVAQAHDTPVFDFATSMPENRKYWADGRHVNEEGAMLKAQLFAEFINGQVEMDPMACTVSRQS